MEVKDKKALPGFTKGEEVFNAVTHIVGASLGVIFLVVGVVFAAIYGDALAIVAMVIYGISLILLYIASSIYHFLRPNRAKRVFRILDHCSIFLLIAGTYTPFCLILLRDQGAWGWALFSVVWLCAIIGIVFNAINMYDKTVRRVSMTAYLAMGWSCIVAIVPIVRVLHPVGIILTALGGVAYTVGAVFYALGHKKKYIHSIWHLFVLLGSILQFFAILFFVVM
ncbi:MAG: hemolysin III family protein [Firmicutes bacterium]|nr:hemolysin III family protein [Bacillota bacterium]